MEKDSFSPDPYHFWFFPVLMPLVLVCILFNAIVGSIPAIFMQKVIAVVEETGSLVTGMAARTRFCIIQAFFLLFTVWLWQLPFFITGKWQRSPMGTLKKLREKLFNSMQDFPVNI